jgi:predicted DNA-binding antitoxin AbrB/MazE fold protein
MTIPARYENGVFRPLGDVRISDVHPRSEVA